MSSSSSEEQTHSTITSSITRRRRSPSSSSDLLSNISSSPSNSLPHHQQPPPRPRGAMEDIWEDISLTSLHHHHNNNSSNRLTTILTPDGTNFQNFLSTTPTCYNLNKNSSSSSSPSSTATFFGSLNNATPSYPTSPHSSSIINPTHSATALSLNTGHGNGPLTVRPAKPKPNPIPYISSSSHPYDGFGSCFGKSGFPSSGESCNSSGTTTRAEKKHTRLIKNRESAARSRARKQAYTNELEYKIETLKEVNEKLRQEYERVLSENSIEFLRKESKTLNLKQSGKLSQGQRSQALQAPRKRLERSATAPF